MTDTPTMEALACALEDAARWIARLTEAPDYHDIQGAKEDRERLLALAAASRPPILYAGVDGVWHGKASVTGGISLGDMTDKYNEPACITRSPQTDGAAYRKAAKVWDAVKGAKSMSEAADILRAAGCKLHYYCRVD